MKQQFIGIAAKTASALTASVFAISTFAVSQNMANAASFLSQLPTPPQISVSTVPLNGDVNPYGVAFVPNNVWENKLHSGDVLVANFNNSDNLQGTGTTIEDISIKGTVTPFYAGPTGLGLDTGLGVFKSGYVIVGNLPSTDGSSATAMQGSLIILDSKGKVVETLVDKKFLDGPWDLTISDYGWFAQVFVSNALDGTVTRLDFLTPDHKAPILIQKTKVAEGYIHHGDPSAFEVAPTGLALDPSTDTLYVASTGDNAIYAVHDASDRHGAAWLGKLVYEDNAHLRGPLGLVIAPNGHLITANGDAVNGDPNFASELVEFTKTGKFVDQVPVDTGGQGGAFGVAIEQVYVCPRIITRFAAVDDITNFLNVWNLIAH